MTLRSWQGMGEASLPCLTDACHLRVDRGADSKFIKKLPIDKVAWHIMSAALKSLCVHFWV